MPDPRYYDAHKLGNREYRSCISRGEYPYLPALDEMLPDHSRSDEVDLGILQIPAEKIVGTKTRGRSNSFARNFMPIAPDNSEFAGKWEHLCIAHLREGIRDPIKAYEYLGRYYVEEGNKRTSILKFFDAVTIPAHVIRILPERNGSKEVEMYYEYVDFFALSGLVEVEFTKPGSYERLQELMGMEKGHVWTQEEKSNFKSVYYTFKTLYQAMGGGQIRATVSDALLAYLTVYPYKDICQKSDQEIKKELQQVWEDIALIEDEDPIDVKLTPENKSPSLIDRILIGTDTGEMRVAFVHDSSPEASSWTRGHERGREYLEQVMGREIETKAYFHALSEDPEKVIRQAIEDGSSTIFTTSPRLLPAALKVAVENPQATIFNCSLNQSHRYIRTYYARMYEVKFIIGAVAGSMAREDMVGYLCDYPIFGQIAGINAFALGAQMVNPRARVCLEWSSVGGVDAAIKRMTDKGVKLISSQDMVRQGDEWRMLGLSRVEGGQVEKMVRPLWQWGTYYEELLRRVKNRSAQAEYQQSGKALSYYWGLSAGVVDLMCSDRLPDPVKKMVDILKKSICAGLCNPFQGPLYTQNGQTLQNDQILTPEQIINMDYLVENVEGIIPQYDTLSDVAKATVDLVGVESVTKEKRGA